MKDLILSIILLLTLTLTYSQEAFIEFESDQFKNEFVRIHHELDPFSKSSKVLDSAYLEATGIGSVNLTIDKPELLSIKVRNLVSQIWVAPGDSIQLSIKDPRLPEYPGELRMQDMGSSRFYEVELDSCTNIVYDTLHETLRKQFQMGRDIEQLDSLVIWSKSLPFSDNVREHGEYLIYGALNYAGYSDSILYHKALAGAESPMYIPAFRILFEQYYQRHLLNLYRSSAKRLNLARAQNDLSREVLRIAKENTMINQAFVDEALFTFFQSEVYKAVFSPSDRYRVLSLLSVSGNPESLVIYKRIRHQDTYLSPGTRVPEINLIDNNLNSFYFDQDDRIVLLCFYSQKSTLALREAELLEKIAEERKKSLRTCIIRVEDPNTELQQLFSKNAPIERYFFQQNWDLIEAYRVTGYPRYVLVSSDGKMIQDSFESILHVDQVLESWESELFDENDPYGIQERMKRESD